MIEMLHALFAGTSLLLAFLIFTNTQKINIKANKWFSGFIFSVFLIAFLTVLDDWNRAEDHFLLAIISILTCFSIGPLFYFSISYFTNPNASWNNKNYFHFLIPVLITVFTTFLNSSEDNDMNLFLAKSIEITLITILIIQLLLYPILSYIKLVKHKKNIHFFSSNTEKIDLKWLQYLSISIVIMIFFWIIEIILDAVSIKIQIIPYINETIYLSGIFFITHNWLKQTEIYPFNTTINIDEIINELNASEEKKKKLIEDNDLQDFKEKLLQIMNDKKPFLDGELNLEKLALEMNTSTHILSYIINTGFNENFYQFINRYRIEEAKKLIKNATDLSLLGIGFAVGFNSKTTFNTTFKKLTHKTPSEYKKMSSDL